MTLAPARIHLTTLRVFLALSGFSLVFGVQPSAAISTEQVDSITEHVRRGAPVPSPTCGTTCTAFRNAEIAATPKTNPRWRNVLRLANELRGRAKVLPRLSFPYRIAVGPQVAAGATAVYYGFRLGQGAYSKFVELGFFGGDGSARPTVAAFTLSYVPEGSGAGTWGDPPFIYFDYPVLQLGYRYETDSSGTNRTYFTEAPNPPTEECANEPGSFELTHLVWEGMDTCYIDYYNRPTHFVRRGIHVAPADFGGEGGPNPASALEDYNGQPYMVEIPAPDDLGFEDTRARVQEELDGRSLHYEDLIDWYNYHAGAPGSIDPVTGQVRIPEFAGEPGQSYESYAQALTELGLTPVPVEAPQHDYDWDEDAVVGVAPEVGTSAESETEVRVTVNPKTQAHEPDCELSAPLGHDPAPERGDDVSLRYVVKQTELGLPETYTRTYQGQTYETVLRYGRIRRQVDGWGWRHILAKHGWSAADREATRLTLLSPVNVTRQGDRYTYTGAQYAGRNGALCARVVVVEKAQLSWEPAPREIISSFGAKP